MGEVDISTVALNDTVTALTEPTEIGDYDLDGIPGLMVKFYKADVQSLLTAGDAVEITITGEVAEIRFGGSDTIRVIK